MVYTKTITLVSFIFIGININNKTTGAPLTWLPNTPLPINAPLTHNHPAVGGPRTPDMIQPVALTADGRTTTNMMINASSSDLIINNSNNTSNSSRRRLELSTNVDIQQLESYFQTPLIKNVDELQRQFASAEVLPSPWPGSYWPTYKDSINHRWFSINELSPAEKYAKAFNLDVVAFKNKISQINGIDSCPYCKACKSNSECSNDDVCGIRQDSNTGRCMATWWGICHAWSPAAILEPEGKCSVTVNNVTFRVGDIKALITLLYDGANVPVIFTGARYDGATSPVDSYGRYTDAAERDLGPGFMHIAILNIMGRFRKSFVVDVTPSSQVWNQPVRSYSIIELRKMNPLDAMRQYFNPSASIYVFNNAAVSVAYVNMAFRYIIEDGRDGPIVSTGGVESNTVTVNYEYLLELDNENNIIGGEWVGNSRAKHPDFLWFVTKKPNAGTITSVNLNYDKISDLLSKSVACLHTDRGNDDGSCGSDLSGVLPCLNNDQYCQPWNPSEYQCRSVPSQCGKQETGFDYYGDDIKTISVLLPEQCCDECFKTQGCRAYTFVNYNPDRKPYCYLKRGSGNRQPKVGAVSALIQSPPSCLTKTWESCGSASTNAQCCPPSDYCQPWDMRFFQCVPKPLMCSNLYSQTDFYGDDIKTVFGLNPWDCCNECSKTPGCKTYTFVNDNANTPACYLKSGTGNQRFHATAVSGKLN